MRNEKYVVELRNAAIYHADDPFGSRSEERLLRQGEMVLSDVSLTVAPGELVYLIGRVGSGKSTLLSILSGYQKPDRGRVFYQGADVHRMRARDRARVFAVVWQRETVAMPFTALASISLRSLCTRSMP